MNPNGTSGLHPWRYDILDDGASQHRTTAVNKVLTDFAQNPAVQSLGTLYGAWTSSISVKSNYGTFFALLKPSGASVKKYDMSSDAVLKTVGAVISWPKHLSWALRPAHQRHRHLGGFEGYIQMYRHQAPA